MNFILNLPDLKNVVVRNFAEVEPLPTDITREYQKQELLGQVVADNLTFGEYRDENTSLQAYTLTSALMSVSQRKNIVSTVVVGRNGSVNQYVSDSDYEIDIRGAIIETAEGLPEMIRIASFLRLPRSLSIFSDFLAVFGIEKIVVKSFKFTQKEGHEKLFILEISASSDVPINLNDYVTS